MTDLVLHQHLNHLLVVRCLVGVFDGSNLLSFWVRCVNEIGPSPLGVGLLDMVGISFVVGLHLVGQTVRNVNGGQVNGDEERPVVVGRVPGRGLNVAVSRDSDVKGAVLWCIVRVLEPHGANKVNLFASGHPRAVFNVL